MSLWYLATPYSNYHLGMETAYIHACQQAAVLIKDGLSVYSPIAHAHPIAMHGKIDPTHAFDWMAVDRPLMEAAAGLIVCMSPGWQESKGVKQEIEYFEGARKRIYYMAPGFVPFVLSSASEQKRQWDSCNA